MLTGFVFLSTVTVLPWKSCAERVGSILCAMHQAAEQAQMKNSNGMKYLEKETEQRGLWDVLKSGSCCNVHCGDL